MTSLYMNLYRNESQFPLLFSFCIKRQLQNLKANHWLNTKMQNYNQVYVPLHKLSENFPLGLLENK